MNTAELTQAVQFTVDQRGQVTAVVLTPELWQRIAEALEDAEDRELVQPDGSIHVPPMPDIAPGEYRAALVVEEAAPHCAPKPPLRLKMLDWSAWPHGSTFRREELYEGAQ